jgi:carbamoyl-phosphate synthase large subunit
MTYEFAKKNQIYAPETFLDLESALDSLKKNKVQFPLIVKPRWGSGSIGLLVAYTQDELVHFFSQCEAIVKKTFLNQISDVNHSVIIQEYIIGDEYGVDILNDLNKKLLGYTVKKKIAMRAGETDKAVTVPSAALDEYLVRIAENLGHIGNLDCDFLEKDGKFYLIEMNARFGGGYPFTHLAGANHILHLLGPKQGLTPHKYEYKINVGFAKCDMLVPILS